MKGVKTMEKNKILKTAFLVALIVGTVLIIRENSSKTYQRDEGKIFGTFYHITYQSGENLHDEILAELQRVDRSLSMFNDSSTISRINRNEAVDLSVDSLFVEVYELAQRIADDTDGAFDITVAPLVNAWGFGFKNEQMPTARQVDSLRQFIGMNMVELSERPVSVQKKDPRTMLDFSAIAKGYGVDAVANLLESSGVKNYMIEIGGEVITRGVSPHRVPWRIGVTKPTDDSLQVGSELQTVLNITDMAMATSGNYRNFYYKNGRKYAHTIDPQSGYPVQHSILSATVLAKNCATADAYATSFMVMGLERAKAVLEHHDDMMAYFIYSDAQGQLAVWYSPSLKEKICE